MKKMLLKNKIFLLAMVLAFVSLKCPVQAAESGYSATATGTYRNPLTDEIEDSGGEENYALGQSMVDSMVDTTAYIENTDDGYGIYFKFHLMDNISKVSFQTSQGGADFVNASYASVGTTDESEDFYIPVSDKDTVVKAVCYVDAMGRSVTFFVSFSDLQEAANTAFTAYDGSELISSEDSSATDTSTVVGSTEDGASIGEGLTIGYAEETEDEDTSEEEEEDGLVIDDSIWMLLFAVVFSAVFLAGLLLIIIVLVIKKIQLSKAKIKELNLKKYDRFQDEEDDFDKTEILLGDE